MKLNKEIVEIKIADKGVILQEFCELAGITRVTLNAALNGKSNLRLGTVGKIAEALGVSSEEIIKKEEVN